MAITKKDCKNTLLFLCFTAAIYQFNFVNARRESDNDSASDQKTFNVLDFGANAGGSQNSARAFSRAFQAACQWKGNARMLVPQGIYSMGPVSFKGPCRSKSPLVIETTGTIEAYQDNSLYECKEWVNFQKLNGLILTGSGSFDGQGPAVWKNKRLKTRLSSGYVYFNGQGPAIWKNKRLKTDHECDDHENLMFQEVKNVVIRGIKSVNSKGFHVFITNSEKIRVYEMEIVAPADSPNTDGIHISKSSDVKVYETFISTGDDCVSMIQGCTNITIKRVTCAAGHGFSIGSLGKYKKERDVRDITVKNCTLSDTDNGLRIKTWGGSPPSEASGIIFQNIIMKNVRNPIIIDQNYGLATDKPSGVKINDVKYIDVRGTSSSDIAVNLVCSSGAPCRNLELKDINLKYAENLHKKVLSLSSSCVNANVQYIGVQNPPPCRGLSGSNLDSWKLS